MEKNSAIEETNYLKNMGVLDEIEKNKNDETVSLGKIDWDNLEKDLLIENEKLRKENIELKKKIEKYREIEVALSTEIDMLKLGITE